MNPPPAVCRVFPVSPPNWNTKSALLVVETPMLHGTLLRHAMLACALGNAGLGSKGLVVFAPDTPKAITPYHVSPVNDVWMDMLSPVNGDGAIAYHV